MTDPFITVQGGSNLYNPSTGQAFEGEVNLDAILLDVRFPLQAEWTRHGVYRGDIVPFAERRVIVRRGKGQDAG
jgi:hypothetical protein